MYYEINIAKNGTHFFATAKRSIRDRKKLATVYHTLEKAFPKEEGYDMIISHYEERGILINPEDI